MIDDTILREHLAAARLAKLAGGGRREREQADLLRRVIEGEALGELEVPRAMGLVAHWLPVGTPWDATLPLVQRSLCEAFIKLARDAYEWQANSRRGTEGRLRKMAAMLNRLPPLASR